MFRIEMRYLRIGGLGIMMRVGILLALMLLISIPNAFAQPDYNDEKLCEIVDTLQFNEFNYNEIGAVLDLNPIKIDFNYLQEDKHIGNQEYFKTKIDLAQNKNGLISFETKRNLLKNSSEFYNLSYEYINDCLRAGLVYRREFYNDSELEPENSLMFKVTLTPFGKIDSPTFSK